MKIFADVPANVTAGVCEPISTVPVSLVLNRFTSLVPAG